MNGQVNIWHEVIPQWIAACGTVAAVIVALFGNLIRNKFNKPKIEISCGKDTPFIEKNTENYQGQNIDNEVRLRIKITNKGNITANHTLLIVSNYYLLCDDGRYIKTEFTPKQIKDYNGGFPRQIAPHLEYFFDLFSIQKIDNLRTHEENGHQRQFYKALIVGDGKMITLKKGTYIVPIKFYSAKTETVVAYVKFFWNSDDLNLNPEYFSFSIISENEFKNLKTEERC